MICIIGLVPAGAAERRGNVMNYKQRKRMLSVGVAAALCAAASAAFAAGPKIVSGPADDP